MGAARRDYCDQLRGPKILYNETSKKFHAYFDEGEVISNKTLFRYAHLIPFLMGLLMSKLAHFVFAWTFPSYGIPVLVAAFSFVVILGESSSQKLVPCNRDFRSGAGMHEGSKFDNTRELTKLELNLDKAVYRLYDLTSAEIKNLKETLVFKKREHINLIRTPS